MTEILDDQMSPALDRRRKLLPVWIKIFLWIFMIFGAIVPLGLVAGITGVSFSLALYGLDTTNPFSILGIVITLLFTVKGAVSFGLWTEKDWAVDLAILEALLGIILCTLMMIVTPFLEEGGFTLNIRFELIALIPYYIKMKRIKGDWAKKT